MKKIDFNYDEIVNYYKLPNGLRVYLLIMVRIIIFLDMKIL